MHRQDSSNLNPALKKLDFSVEAEVIDLFYQGVSVLVDLIQVGAWDLVTIAMEVDFHVGNVVINTDGDPLTGFV